MNNKVDNKKTGEIILRRYTNLAATIHHLHTKTITLLDPKTWDDKNDAFFMETYKNKRNAKTVLALCFAESFERSHHWHVFAGGVDGVCIEFYKNRLLKTLNEAVGFKHRSMDYTSIKDLNELPPNLEKLPFLKRIPYKDEEEYRIIYVNERKTMVTKPINIEISWIRRITLSPWMPRELALSAKEVLKKIDECDDLPIYRSTLIESENWKNTVSRIQL